MHHSCHRDAALADDSLEWRWPRDVTPKYLYRPALFRWLKKCRQGDPSGIVTYPWQGSALTATLSSDLKILRIGLQGFAEACMVLSEAALYALFMVWQKAGLGEAIAAESVSGGNQKARAGGYKMGMADSLFSTMCEAFWKKYMTFTTMGHMARHPDHCWRQGQRFWAALGAPRQPLALWHTQVHHQRHPVL